MNDLYPIITRLLSHLSLQRLVCYCDSTYNSMFHLYPFSPLDAERTKEKQYPPIKLRPHNNLSVMNPSRPPRSRDLLQLVPQIRLCNPDLLRFRTSRRYIP
jgi:hypothetical protein